MGLLNVLKAANDWHADKLYNGGRVMAHSSKSGGGLPSTHCSGCGKPARKRIDVSRNKSVGWCGKAKCSTKLAAHMKSKG